MFGILASTARLFDVGRTDARRSSARFGYDMQAWTEVSVPNASLARADISSATHLERRRIPSAFDVHTRGDIHELLACV